MCFIFTVMKNFIQLGLACLFSISMIGCASNRPFTQSDLTQEQVAQAIAQENFKFIATRAFPMGTTVSNVMDHLRPHGSNTQILNLDYNYGFTLKGSQLEVDLPYFGERYHANMNPDSNGLKFKTSNAQVSSSKKGSRTAFTIIPNQGNVNKMFLEVYDNGSAFLSVSSNDRQPISYQGYITKISE